MAGIENENAELKRKYSEIQTHNEILSKQIQTLTKENKSKNIIILYKLEDSQVFNKELFLNINNTLSKYVENFDKNWIADIRRIGKSQGRRPTLVSFISKASKSRVFESLMSQENLNFAFDNDLTAEELQLKSTLKNHVVKLKNQGVDAKLRRSGIMIGNKFYNLTLLLQKFGNILISDEPCNESSAATRPEVFSTPSSIPTTKESSRSRLPRAVKQHSVQSGKPHSRDMRDFLNKKTSDQGDR